MTKNAIKRNLDHQQVAGNTEPPSTQSNENEPVTEQDQALQEAFEDDKRKAAALRWAANHHFDSVEEEQVLALSKRLDAVQRGNDRGEPDARGTAASSVTATKHMLKYGSALEHAFSDEGDGMFAFRVYPRGWRYSIEGLANAEAPGLLATIAHTFHAVGIDDKQGILWGTLRGEYDPLREHFRICLCGIASSGIAKLISALKAFPRFKDPDDFDEGWHNEHWNDPIGVRVWANPITRLSDNLPWLFSTHWAQCPTVFDGGGEVKRIVDLREMPQPQLSRALLWLDRWDLAQLNMAIGLGDFEDGLGRAHSFLDY